MLFMSLKLSMKIEKVWHPYLDWEDYKNGMWSIADSSKRKSLLKKAYDFTGDHKLYGSFMMRVIKEWPVACEHHLTNINSNRRAWIGHAACCLAIGCPEDITRKAWSYLSDEQHDLANNEADKAILEWELNYVRKNTDIH